LVTTSESSHFLLFLEAKINLRVSASMDMTLGARRITQFLAIALSLPTVIGTFGKY
jgi:hypothetical protein